MDLCCRLFMARDSDDFDPLPKNCLPNNNNNNIRLIFSYITKGNQKRKNCGAIDPAPPSQNQISNKKKVAHDET